MEVVAQLVRAGVCEASGCGFKSRRPPQNNMNQIKVLRKLNEPKGGVSMDTDAVLSVLREYDRMPDNQDFPNSEFVKRVLDQYGYLTMFVFVCPATRGKYLTTDKKELFMPSDEPGNGLLFARVPKLKALIASLWQVGVPSKLLFVVADNSYELYRGPVEGVTLDPELMDERRKLYCANLTARLSKDFQQLMEVFSLGLNRVGMSPEDTNIPTDVLAQEVAFQKDVVYAQYYSGKLPEDGVIERIVRGKCRAYAEQGLWIEATDALLIGTEGSDTIASWRLRTKMFRVSGAKFPVIYPYIRKDVLERRWPNVEVGSGFRRDWSSLDKS